MKKGVGVCTKCGGVIECPECANDSESALTALLTELNKLIDRWDEKEDSSINAAQSFGSISFLSRAAQLGLSAKQLRKVISSYS